MSDKRAWYAVPGGLLEGEEEAEMEVAMLHILMSVIADGSKWQRRLSDVVTGHPKANLRIMGFPPDWRQDPFWRLS